MRIYFTNLIVTLLSSLSSAYAATMIEGKVTDFMGDPIVGATVIVEQNPSKGATTNHTGQYRLTLPDGEYDLAASSLGYEKQSKKVTAKGNRESLNFKLNIEAKEITAVVVNSRKWDDRVTSTQIGAEKIVLSEMAKTPALFGEKDVVKSMTLMPGVKSQGDGQSGIMVRGGSVTQNLLLLDNTSLYNSGHALGVFSVINGDALSEATLYKGLIPAQYGGAASSIFDIRTKSGDLRNYKFGLDVGLLSAKVLAEGPIAKDKASFFITARRSYFDIFLKLSDEYKDTVINFYDINASLYYKINERNALSFSLFSGCDNLGLASLIEMDWGNLNSSLNWFHRYTYRLTSNTTFVNSGYNATTNLSAGGTSLSMNGDIKIFGLIHEFILAKENHTLRFGVQSSHVNNVSADWSLDGYQEDEERHGIESAGWVNDEWKVTPNITISMGLRLNNFVALGGSPYYTFDEDGEIDETLEYGTFEAVKSYLVLEPRISSNFRLSETRSVKLGYARSSQNIYRIENNTMMIPFTRYTMASNFLEPLISDQVSLGYVNLTNDQVFEFSAEGYFKTTKNVFDYKDGKTLTSDIAMETLLAEGKGRAYGVELLAKKNKGHLAGWIAYTLSWSETKIDSINNGDWYASSGDMRHSLSIVGMCPLSARWSVAASWVLTTGRPLSAPSAKYEIDGETAYYYAERNGYRTPAYHRLDINFTNRKVNRNYTREWSFGLFNVYNHLNPFLITFEDDMESVSGSKTVQYSLYGILPSVNYSIKF